MRSRCSSHRPSTTCITSPLAAILAAAASLVAVVHAEEGTTPQIHENSFANLPTWVVVTVLILALIFASFCCGLTIGMMGMDTFMLETVASAGKEPQRTYASKILPLRQLGHQMLVTLIVGNMFANVVASQMVSAFMPKSQTGFIIGFFLATGIIFVFTEVIPISILKSERSLQVAAKCVPSLKVLMLVMYPIAKPLGWLLDYLVAHDCGQVYDRNEFKRLVEIHCDKHAGKSGVGMDELRMIVGALEFSETTAESIMTPMEQVFMLEASMSIDSQLMEKLWVAGCSRVPVYVRTRKDIIGVLFVKDLVTNAVLSMEGSLTVLDVLRDNPRDFYVVKNVISLQELLRIFESGSSSLVLVESLPKISMSQLNSPSAMKIKSEATKNTHSNKGAHVKFAKTATEMETVEEKIPMYERVPWSTPTAAAAVPNTTNTGNASLEENRATSIVLSSPLNQPPVPSKSRFTKPSPSDWVVSQREGLGVQMVVPHTRPGSYVGVVTLEDVIESLIKEEIYDEYDAEAPSTDSESENDLARRPATRIRSPGLNKSISLLQSDIPVPPRHMPRVNFYSYYVDDTEDTVLDDSQKWALAQYMVNTFVFFASWKLKIVKMLIDTVGDRIIRVNKEAQRSGEELDTLSAHITSDNLPDVVSEYVLYKDNVPSDTFTLILSGGVRMALGHESFVSEVRSFTAFGEAVLLDGSFTPEYTAFVSRNSRILQIRFEDIVDLQARVHQYRQMRKQSVVDFFSPTGTPRTAIPGLPHKPSFTSRNQTGKTAGHEANVESPIVSIPSSGARKRQERATDIVVVEDEAPRANVQPGGSLGQTSGTEGKKAVVKAVENSGRREADRVEEEEIPL